MAILICFGIFPLNLSPKCHAQKHKTPQINDLRGSIRTEGGNRTRTLLPELDFESSASTNSATSATFGICKNTKIDRTYTDRPCFFTTGRKLCRFIFDRGLFALCSESSSGIHYISATKNRLQ